MHWEKEIIRPLEDYGIWTDPNSRRFRTSQNISQARSNGSQVVNGVLAQLHLTVGLVGPQIRSVAISPVLECLMGGDIFSN